MSLGKFSELCDRISKWPPLFALRSPLSWSREGLFVSSSINKARAESKKEEEEVVLFRILKNPTIERDKSPFLLLSYFLESNCWEFSSSFLTFESSDDLTNQFYAALTYYCCFEDSETELKDRFRKNSLGKIVTVEKRINSWQPTRKLPCVIWNHSGWCFRVLEQDGFPTLQIRDPDRIEYMSLKQDKKGKWRLVFSDLSPDQSLQCCTVISTCFAEEKVFLSEETKTVDVLTAKKVEEEVKKWPKLVEMVWESNFSVGNLQVYHTGSREKNVFYLSPSISDFAFASRMEICYDREVQKWSVDFGKYCSSFFSAVDLKMFYESFMAHGCFVFDKEKEGEKEGDEKEAVVPLDLLDDLGRLFSLSVQVSKWDMDPDSLGYFGFWQQLFEVKEEQIEIQVSKYISFWLIARFKSSEKERETASKCLSLRYCEKKKKWEFAYTNLLPLDAVRLFQETQTFFQNRHHQKKEDKKEKKEEEKIEETSKKKNAVEELANLLSSWPKLSDYMQWEGCWTIRHLQVESFSWKNCMTFHLTKQQPLLGTLSYFVLDYQKQSGEWSSAIPLTCSEETYSSLATDFQEDVSLFYQALLSHGCFINLNKKVEFPLVYSDSLNTWSSLGKQVSEWNLHPDSIVCDKDSKTKKFSNEENNLSVRVTFWTARVWIFISSSLYNEEPELELVFCPETQKWLFVRSGFSPERSLFLFQETKPLFDQTKTETETGEQREDKPHCLENKEKEEE